MFLLFQSKRYHILRETDEEFSQQLCAFYAWMSLIVEQHPSFALLSNSLVSCSWLSAFHTGVCNELQEVFFCFVKYNGYAKRSQVKRM